MSFLQTCAQNDQPFSKEMNIRYFVFLIFFTEARGRGTSYRKNKDSEYGSAKLSRIWRVLINTAQ